MPAESALEVWDALIRAGHPHDIKPAGMLALDVARDGKTFTGGGPTQVQLDRLGTVKVVDDADWMSATAGSWSPSRRAIRLNLRLLTTERDYLDTLRHEWGHALDSVLSGGRGHSPTWKRWARALGDDAERCHKIDVAERMPERFTKVGCACGTVITLSGRQATKIKRHPGRYRCRKCKAPISLGAVDPTAKAMFCRLITEGVLSDDEIFGQVQRRFKLEDKSRGHVSWYRCWLKRQGKNKLAAGAKGGTVRGSGGNE